MEEIDHDGAQGPHQDVQDREKDESSNSIGHEDYHPIWLENGTFLLVHEGWGGHWLVGKISNFHWTRKQAQGGVLEGYQGGEEYLIFWGENKKKMEVWKGD